MISPDYMGDNADSIILTSPIHMHMFLNCLGIYAFLEIVSVLDCPAYTVFTWEDYPEITLSQSRDIRRTQ
jgi:hypothetical protein